MLKLIIVSPEKQLYQGDAQSVKVPGSLGEFEILDNHAPIISSLDAGQVVYVTGEGETHECAITVGKQKWRFICQSLITLALLAIGVYGVAELFLGYAVALPLLVSSVVFLIIETADILVWSRVAIKSPDSLPTFFLGVSGFRMLLCVLVFFVYYFVVERQAMLLFLCVFALFYAAMLVHHATFFSNDKRKSGT